VASYELSKAQRPPGWLLGRWGRAWDNVLRYIGDVLVAGIKLAQKVRIIALCPADALPYHGRERMIERGGSTTEEAYRAQLEAAPTMWQDGGTDDGIRVGIIYYFDTANVAVYSRNADGFEVDADASTHWWSRFWVIVDKPNDWDTLEFPFTFGPEVVFGTTMTANELAGMRRHIERWRACHELAIQLVIIHDASITSGDILADPLLLADPLVCPITLGTFFGYAHAETFGDNFVFTD
jgi:hypothetical protein